jgi:hypothetical protein
MEVPEGSVERHSVNIRETFRVCHELSSKLQQIVAVGRSCEVICGIHLVNPAAYASYRLVVLEGVVD